MLTAAKEGTFSASSDPCVLFPLAAAGVYPKTRVWGSKPENVHCSSATAPLKIELRWGCEESSEKTAVGSGVSFKYDPFGRRTEKISPTTTSIFAYDGDNQIEETNSSGAAVARYSQGLNIDEPLAMLRSATTSYYQADGLGSITSLSSGAGALAQTYGYDSFGKQTSSSGSLTNPFQYTARESDPETGLYYYRARYYDASTGRFLSEDPNKDGVAGSLYGYVENSPLLLIDPFGTQGLAPGSKNTPDQVSAFNSGFAEALNRLKNPECRKLFCEGQKKNKKNNQNLDPAGVLNHTEYRIIPFPGNSQAGAVTNSTYNVFLNSNGPFFGKEPTVYIPSDRPGITSLRPVPFASLDQVRAFILLHELGHQLLIFPPDQFPFVNGMHSLRVLESCFKDVHFE